MSIIAARRGGTYGPHSPVKASAKLLGASGKVASGRSGFASKVLMALAAFGCSGTDTLRVHAELPEDVRWLALFAARGGALVAESHFSEAGREYELLSFTDDPDELFLAGYSEEQLAQSFPPPDGGVLGSVVRPSESPPQLTPPSWFARGPLVDGDVELEVSTPLGLTADWMPERCGGEDTRSCEPVAVAIEIVCDDEPLPCAVEVVQRNCAIEIDASACLLGKHSGTIEGSRSACLVANGQDCRQSGRGFECVAETGRCRFTPRVIAEPPGLEIVARRRLFPNATGEFYASWLARDLSRGQVLSGHAADVAADSTRALVLTHDGRAAGAGFDTENGRAFVLDSKTFEPIADFQVPSNPAVAAADRGGFVLAFKSPLRLLRVEPEGTVTASIAPEELGGTASDYLIPTELIPYRDKLILVGFDGIPNQDRTGFVVEVDPETLELGRVHTSPIRGFAVASLDGDSLLIGDDAANEVVRFDLSTMEIAGSIIPFPRLTNWEMGAIVTEQRSRKSILSTLAGSPLLHVLEVDRDEARHALTMPPARATALAQWPGGGAAVLVASLEFHGDRSYASRFSMTTSEIDTQPLELGAGPVRRIVDLGELGLIMLLPWLGEVIRLVSTSPE